MPYQKFHTAKKHEGPTRASINKSAMAGWVELVTPFNELFVAELKSSIQPPHRKWDPEAKVWHVNEIYLDKVVPMLKKYFDEVITDLLQKEPVSSNLFNPIFDVLKTMPNGIMVKIYRSLAFALHPDKGGNNELMAKLNEAYEDAQRK